ncbi:MAG TPA: zinc-binding dehydrogenase [Acidimicrobiales bacterium]|nr:zinc-binding dehydrogenase [Acidimicrobiales bacterium]
MKAVQHAVHGGPDVLELVELPDPVPGPGDVVVAVRSAGLNRLDVLQREGPPLLPRFSLPHVPGMDVAGEVVAVGPAVDGVAVGDRVLVKAGIHCGVCPACLQGDDRRCSAVAVVGGSRPGGYAEQCLVPATHVFALPDGVTYDEAATVPTTLSTAWRALVDTAKVRIGEVVVVHGPGSGVSLSGVQIAKRAGATVIVTGRSDDKLKRVLEVGADYVVNEGDPQMVDAVRELSGGRGADVVFNHVGAALFEQSVKMLRMDGRLVHCGTTTGSTVTLHLPYLYHMGIQILGAGPQSYRGFRSMLEHYWSGPHQAVIDSTFPLEQAAAAQARLESGDAFGKVLLNP